MRAASSPDAPHPVDLHVGSRLADRRRALGYSQAQLARAIGVTFQQEQKYERGANRLSAPRLWDAADFLNTDVNYYIDGLPAIGGGEKPDPAPRIRSTDDASEILRRAERLSARNRKLVLDLVRQLEGAPESADA